MLGVKGKIGGFVETKNTTIGDGAKVPHLTYAGDATIGEGANIGAGTIFANYDGVAKHRTVVGRHSFVGSDSVLVAPVTVADGAYVACRLHRHRGRAVRARSRSPAGSSATSRAGSSAAAPAPPPPRPPAQAPRAGRPAAGAAEQHGSPQHPEEEAHA